MPNNSRTFRVLSLDGGGIKGLYSAEILRHFEEQHACHIADHFDLIGGTSTGGLIALALALRIPAERIVDFYVRHGSQIFPRLKGTKKFLKVIGRGHQYDSRPLQRALVELFGTSRIRDVHSLICIPSYTITEGRPYIFKYDHKEGGLTRDNRTLISDVALATAAAPTFLPIVTLEDHNGRQFIDGGIYANNPTMICTIEALQYFVGVGKTFGSLDVLSISSLEKPIGSCVPTKPRGIYWHLTSEVAPAITSGQSHVVDYMMCQLRDLHEVPLHYLRIPSVAVSADQAPDIGLDVATRSAIKLIKGKGDDAGLIWRRDPEIARFFAEPKHYTIEH